ncbi:zinc-binding alcohol dehydrogenase family protein [Actinoplanes sp. KI2]|uniref:quinone oxidoreductase family protein n=1 Tax=Actinoplanes sp. KI2 TaxID=2983315 RepID=UPI0021D614AD|nr:zinc-binding alcohol dehydrogenase family protein [Actinoplanes sp. KI2]MCU7728667.1 zinc-binding alcohol dehydrogenase family protein [Actinoplanes sp. KI2]
MKAAVVTSFAEPPHYRDFEAPRPRDGEITLDVVAVGLHPRTRSGAAGNHYTSTGRLPMIPGIDGVGRRADGRLVYFVGGDDVLGTMAEQVAVDPRRTVELPDDVDAARIAAAMNPAMSSWVALRRRVPVRPGQSVLVLGAAGNAGSMAMRVAKLLGAGEVLGAARRPGEGILGLDEVARAGHVDLVLDYLWGEPAEQAIMAILTARSDRGRELNWVQIGSVAGPTIQLPSVALRSANFRLQGNGQGAVSAKAYLAELPALIDEIGRGTIAIVPRPTPLSEVETAWAHRDAPGERTVLVTGR